MNKNIFITGAEGFIGSHLVEQLAKNGNYNIKALVLYNFSSDIGWLNTIDKKSNNIEIPKLLWEI